MALNFVFAFIFVMAAVAETCAQGLPRYHAVAYLRAAEASEFSMGQLQLLQYSVGGPTIIIGVIKFPPNTVRSQFLALHIHEYGDVSEGCKWVGSHYNPYRQIHGGPTDQLRHVGDLGNIVLQGTVALINITDRYVQLVGMNTVIGRTVVLHMNPDDYGKGGSGDSLIDGNSGYPLACGVIGVKGNFSPATANRNKPCMIARFFCLILVFVKMLLINWHF